MRDKVSRGALRLYTFSNSWTGTVIIVLFIIFFIAQAFVIPSGSMKRTLLVGDHLFVKKFVYGVPTPHIPWLEIPVLPDFNGNGHLIEGDKPQRGDIVIFRYPLNKKIHYVKRCVATGGDILFVHQKDLYIHFNEGNEYIEQNYPKEQIVTLDNFKFVRNPYMSEHVGIHHDNNVTPSSNTPEQVFELAPIQVPEGEFFMMGDNRDHSNDSRFWGTVKYRDIVGKPWFIYFSWDDDFNIHWDRVGKSVAQIEAQMEENLSDNGR